MARHRRFRLATVMFVLIGTLATALPSIGAAQPAGPDTELADAAASAPDFNGPIGPTFTLPRWSDTSQWDRPEYYSTIQLADVDGDGRQELLGRSPRGMEVWTFIPEQGQWQALAVEGPLADSGGWGAAGYYSTIQAGDIDGDGADELLARSGAGMQTFKWDKDKQEWELLRAANPGFSDAGGWDQQQYYSTIQTGDIDGDGADELLARAGIGMATYKWDKDKREWGLLRAGNPGFTDHANWGQPEYYETIQTGDIDGDGPEELLARGRDGMQTYKWDKDKREWELIREENPFWTDERGWDQAKYYATIQTGDIDGDGAVELLARSPAVGRDAAGMDTWKWFKESGWILLKAGDPAWSDARGWGQPEYYATIQTGDIDGDGADEILGRDGDGMEAYEWKGGAFTRMGRTDNPRLSDHPWKHEAFYSTIQTGDIDGDGQAELVARGTWGVRTWHFATEQHRPNPDTPLHNWGRYLAYGFPAYKNDPAHGGRDGDIYNAINQFLRIEKSPANPDGTVRGGYTLIFSQASTVMEWKTLLAAACNVQEPETNPPTYIDCRFDAGGHTWSGQDVDRISTEIINELSSVIQVDAYFGGLATMYGKLFVDDTNQLNTIAHNLLAAMHKGTSVKSVMRWVDLFGELVSFILVLNGYSEAAQGVEFLFTFVSTSVAAATSPPDIYTSWADAEKDLTDQVENKQTWLNVTEPTYVMSDVGVLKTVGNLQDSTVWAVSAEMEQGFWNLGRQHNATWVYQTFAPSLWWIGLWDNNLTCAPDRINVYNSGDCFWSEVLHGGVGVSPPDNILEAIFEDPDPKHNCDKNWVYGECNLGIKDDDPTTCKIAVNKTVNPGPNCRRAAFFWNFENIGGTRINSNWGIYIRQCPFCFGAVDVDISVGWGFDTSREGPLLDPNLPGTVPVAILSSGEFNALTVDPTSLSFAGASPVGWMIGRDDWREYLARDVNGDGLLDAVIHFELGKLELNHGDTIAWLSGVTTGDPSTDDPSIREIRGAATVQVLARR